MPYNLAEPVVLSPALAASRPLFSSGVTVMHNSFSSPNAGPLGDSAALHDPRVVHSCHGRLRVHLPRWSGTGGEGIAAGVKRLPGVRHAEANWLTGNLLILFDPHMTSAPVLLESLPAVRPDLPVSRPTASSEITESRQGEGHTMVYVEGPRATVYKALGWSSVGMAVVGAITPGIPTAPFVILAGYFFVHSSPQSHEWLLRSRWFGPTMRDWEVHHGVRRSLRNTALALIAGGMAVTALIGLPIPVTVTILSLQVVGAAIVLRLKVVEPAPAVMEGRSLRILTA
jgi:uncharacterized membrane protein YbaN (DUF454 family)